MLDIHWNPRGPNRCTGLLLTVPSRDPRELASRQAEAKALVYSACKFYLLLQQVCPTVTVIVRLQPDRYDAYAREAERNTCTSQ